MPDQRFPILGPKIGGLTHLPWAMLEQHEPQALSNHDQSLRVLASRGGLSYTEALMILTDQRLVMIYKNKVTDEEAHRQIVELIRVFED